MNFDFEDYSPSTNKKALEDLHNKADELLTIQDAIANLELELAQLKSRENEIATRELVRLMEDAGLSIFETPDKRRFTLKEDVFSASYDKAEDRDFVNGYLADNDASSLIKTNVSVDFERGSHNQAISFAEDARLAGLDPTVKETVHAQTYAKFLREKLAEYNQACEDGKAVERPPFEKLNAYVGKKVNVIGKKKK